ncbi:MAG TPA: hypothetical protein DF613_01105 [Lachnospiraceae bacterium]|nr:hypothetical protein [Lachnospiraceae bacterium]
MVKRKYYKQFLTECMQARGNRDLCIWGCRRTGRDLLETLLENELLTASAIHLMDRDLVENRFHGILVEDPEIYLEKKDKFFIICVAELVHTAYRMSERILGQGFKEDEGKVMEGHANFWFYIENIVRKSPELIREEREEYANMMATMYSHQNYVSDLIVGGEYKNVAPITTKIGCPISCKYCPQDVLIKQYRKRENPVMNLTMDVFIRMLEKIPRDVIISFTGFVEPFANPKCLDMILYALDGGYTVRVFSTLYNVSIKDYKKFKDHKNLKTLDVHLPDSNGNTRFPMTEEYKETLAYVFAHPPKYARLWTSCLGVTSHTHEEIRHIISVSGNPINSVHGLVYDNRLFHGRAKLRCNRDCSRIDNEKAGVGMILPNGDVVACTQDWELENCIGNILEAGSWDELMQGAPRRRFREALEDPAVDNICTYCELAVETDQGDKI